MNESLSAIETHRPMFLVITSRQIHRVVRFFNIYIYIYIYERKSSRVASSRQGCRAQLHCGYTVSPLTLSLDEIRIAKSLSVVENFNEEVLMTKSECAKCALLLDITKILV